MKRGRRFMYDKVTYNNAYNATKYDRLTVLVKKGEREILKQIAKEKGYTSLNDYINHLIAEDNK